MKSRLLIVGAGGHGKVVADAALAQDWQNVAFLDADPGRQGILGLEVITGRDIDPQLRQRFDAAVVALSDAARRLALLADLEALGFDLPVIHHPAATVARGVQIGAGSVLFAQAVINPDSTLGRGCILNTAATVDHDCVLGAGVHVAPGAHLAGGVRVGEYSWIGIGACVRENLHIGRQVTIGAGAVVVEDIADGQVVAGVPARPGFRSQR